MEEMYGVILKEGYGLKLYSSSRTRTCLVCSTDRGVFDLKKNIYDEKVIVLEGEIKKSLNKNGFKEVVPFIDTTEEKMFYEYNDCRYTLEQHRNFAPPEENGTWDYVKGACTMAKMHNASFMDEFVCDKINYGRLENVYAKRITQFKRIRKRIKKNGIYDRADMLIKDYYEYYINRAQTALEMLEKLDYMKLSEIAGSKKTFCHNSFKGDNIKIDSKTGQMYVDNFGKAAYDVCVTDLAYYIRQIIKRDDAGKDVVRNVIEAYEDETEFGNTQKSLTCAMVVFPWKFMNLCNEYYNKRKAFTFDASVQRLERCVENIKKEEEIINVLM